MESTLLMGSDLCVLEDWSLVHSVVAEMLEQDPDCPTLLMGVMEQAAWDHLCAGLPSLPTVPPRSLQVALIADAQGLSDLSAVPGIVESRVEDTGPATTRFILVHDMSWTWRRGLAAEDLIEYSRGMARRAAQLGVATVHVYPDSVFPPEARGRFMTCHRSIWTRGSACQNFFYSDHPSPLPTVTCSEEDLLRTLDQVRTHGHIRADLAGTMALTQSLVTRHEQHMATLKKVAECLDPAQSVETALQVALDRLLDLLGMEAGFITLAERKGEEGRRPVERLRGPADPDCFRHSPLRKELATRAVAEQRVVWVRDQHEEGEEPTASEEGVRSCLASPLFTGKRREGLLELLSTGPRGFSVDELQVVSAISRQLGTALENERNVTRERQLLNKLYESEQLAMLGQLISSVAHEVRNPLTGVLGFAELLTMRGNVDGETREMIKYIAQEARRAADVVNNLLTFARKRSGQRSAINLNEVVRSCVQIRQHDLQIARINVALHLEEDLPATHADLSQMRQVFMNLIGNAYDAIRGHRDRGQITVRSRRVGSSVRVTVADDGPGIAPQVLDSLFEAFVTTKGEGQGTGLGLSICRNIMREHAGDIQVNSDPGGGATFVLTLPLLASEPVAGHTSREANRNNTSGCNVLVVDDEPMVCQVVKTILEPQMRQVDTAEGGEEALRLIDRLHYDLVLTDIVMPPVGGLELYRRVSARKATRFLFMTGDTMNHKTGESVERLRVPVLAKPFTRDCLLKAVRESLARAR